jgi:basic membrane lipoprotein Med (substrate-binding protein (PBP1-ABC) superfamily)
MRKLINMSEVKKTKHQIAVENGYAEHEYPDYHSAKTFANNLIANGRDAFYSRLGSKGNYTHYVLVK